jgi:rifampicin phosphotransferase
VVAGNAILEKYLGAKALSIRAQSGGGTQTVAETAVPQRDAEASVPQGDAQVSVPQGGAAASAPPRGAEAAARRQALPDEAILRLAELGRQAAVHFGGPQDMEWSWSAEKMWVVQSRPVTSLFPLPANKRGADHLLVLFNFGTFQGMMDPISPLGRDTFLYLFASMSRVFGARWLPATQPLLYEAGERLFLDLNGLLRHPFGRKAVGLALPMIEPASAQALLPYRDDPRLPLGDGHMAVDTRLHLVRALAPNALRVVANLLFPAARRRRIMAKTNRVVQMVHAERIAAGQNPPDPARLVEFYEQALWKMPPRMLLWLVSMVASGQVAYQLLRRLIGVLPESDRLGLEVTRGLEHNVTTEMDLVLWNTAQAIRRDPAAAEDFQSRTVQVLAADYQAGRMPPAAQSALGAFMERYGVRGIGEIDLGRRRWREDPTPVIQSLLSYLKIDQPDAAPDAVFARGAESGRRAVAQISAQMRREPGGWWKAPLAGWLAGRVRELAGLRETPKFTIIRVFGELRAALLEAGAVWARAGWLERAEDVFFLRLADLKQLALIAAGAPPADNPWRALVEERRAAYQREQRRRQVPRLVIGDGTTIFDGMGGSASSPPQGGGGIPGGENVLVGSAVSPGLVEGIAHVVLDPFGAQLAPGEILVCPGTDPAWTPLFLAAGGLVMEVGGLMTHGSVVAREYGIPAVVGVGQATQRLKTGARIRVDGSRGIVTILG